MTVREIVLDTETTGLDPDAGHRLVEVACLELVNHLPTGRSFRRYMNPERDMPEEALAVHGLTKNFLSTQPLFGAIATELLEFIGDAPLVIHNAEFDLKFINAELTRLGLPPISPRRAIDTVQMARRKFPGAPASLDALCTRFNVDNSGRTVHGALLDAQLLSEVYLELVGGRQATIDLVADASRKIKVIAGERSRRPARPHQPSAEESAAHAALLQRLKNPIWAET